MSSSNWLLNKKGPLATVWVAAFRRVEALTRDQVEGTDIVASVGKILQDVQAPQRILALLLLGIVKIYFKKAEYICDDCNRIFRSIGPRRLVEPSTSTGTSVQVKEAVRAGRQEQTKKAKKSVHTVRITRISGSTCISSEGLPVRRETEINVQASVVVREAPVSVDAPAFTIPERFELDSFDLGIADDISDDNENHHQLSLQDISLEDQRRHAPFSYELNQMTVSSYAVDSCCFMPEYTSVPPELLGAISEVNSILDLSTKGREPERENQNADSVWLTPVKDVLSPETMEIMAKGKDPLNKSKMGDESKRKVNMGEDPSSTCSVFLPESQARQISENIMVNMTSASPHASYPVIEEPENGLFLEKSNTGPQVGEFHDHETEENELPGKSNTEQERFQVHDAEEHESLEPPVLSYETQAINDLSPWTPEPMTEGPPLSSKFMLRTPDKIERRGSTKKGKRKFYNKQDYLPTEKEEKRRRLMAPVIDEVLLLSNNMMSTTIKDASDLIRTRKKVPHTYLGTWKAAKIGSLPDSFKCPLIPYQTPVNLASLNIPKAPETLYGESVKARRCLSYKLSKSSHSCDEATEQERFDESRKRKLGRPTYFDASVASCTESGRLQDDVHGCNDNTTNEKDTQGKDDEPIPAIQPDKGLHESENHTSMHDETFHATAKEDTQGKGDEPILVMRSDKGLNESGNHTSLHNETFHAATYAVDEDASMNEEHDRDGGLLSSRRTRKIASSLHQLFLDRNKDHGSSSLSLNHALEGKERRTSAIFFYETLVLKSRGLIQVNQEQPYEDIMISPTPQLEAELERPCGGSGTDPSGTSS